APRSRPATRSTTRVGARSPRPFARYALRNSLRVPRTRIPASPHRHRAARARPTACRACSPAWPRAWDGAAVARGPRCRASRASSPRRRTRASSAPRESASSAHTAGWPAGDRIAHHDVVEDVDVVVADLLDGARHARHRGGALAVGHARKLHAELHGCNPMAYAMAS